MIVVYYLVELFFVFRGLIRLLFGKIRGCWTKSTLQSVAIIVPSEPHVLLQPFVGSVDLQMERALAQLCFAKVTVFGNYPNAITRENGKPTIERMASSGASISAIESILPVPQLLLVPFSRLELFGFPPLQLKFTEIYHEHGVSWLSRDFIERALVRYNSTVQRYGR